ncbi:MAG TPA: thioesterase family protein [Solirubrobacteraceae bacterium]|jgi:acyl-CoA thioester hydrolase|nr:thioesterase family protein [Solirubrobacteraceae bacterium]
MTAGPSPDRSAWAFSYSDRVRFSDLDAMRHLNNVAFLSFFESARIAFISSVLPEHRPTDPDDFGLIFAECHINYRAPAFFDDQIQTWVRPGAVKRSSFRVEFEMRRESDQRLLAEGYGVLVGYDYGAGRPTPLPERVRGALTERM